MIPLAITLVVVTLAVLAALLWPLLRARPLDVGRKAHSLAVHRDQLAEIDRDVARQLLTDSQADSARTEIHRRILAAERNDPEPMTSAPTAGRLTAVAVVAAGVPIASILLYLTLGSPIRPQGAITASTPSPALSDPAIPHEVAAMVERLAERLKNDPNDAEGWAMLARSYSMMGRHVEAAAAHGRLAALRDNDPAIIAVQAEELIVAADGAVTPEAFALLLKAQARDPSDPRLRFYLGLAQAQSGDVDGAMRTWLELERDAPADAQWLPGLKDQIQRAGEDLGLSPELMNARRAEIAALPRLPIAPPSAPAPTVAPARPPSAQAAAPTGPRAQPPAGAPAASAPSSAPSSAPRGPSASDVAAAGQMAPAERLQMIEGMVGSLAAKLEAQPADPEGWQRLARAYRVLNRSAEADLAARRALDYAPDRLTGLRGYAGGMIEAAGASPPPATLEPVLKEILSLAPDDAPALWNLGLVSLSQGRTADAKLAWSKLLAQTPAGTPEHARLQERLKGLP